MEEKPIEFTPGWVAREEVEEKGTSNKGKLMNVKQKKTPFRFTKSLKVG